MSVPPPPPPMRYKPKKAVAPTAAPSEGATTTGGAPQGPTPKSPIDDPKHNPVAVGGGDGELGPSVDGGLPSPTKLRTAASAGSSGVPQPYIVAMPPPPGSGQQQQHQHQPNREGGQQPTQFKTSGSRQFDGEGSHSPGSPRRDTAEPTPTQFAATRQHQLQEEALAARQQQQMQLQQQQLEQQQLRQQAREREMQMQIQREREQQQRSSSDVRQQQIQTRTEQDLIDELQRENNLLQSRLAQFLSVTQPPASEGEIASGRGRVAAASADLDLEALPAPLLAARVRQLEAGLQLECIERERLARQCDAQRRMITKLIEQVNHSGGGGRQVQPVSGHALAQYRQ